MLEPANRRRGHEAQQDEAAVAMVGAWRSEAKVELVLVRKLRPGFGGLQGPAATPSAGGNNLGSYKEESVKFVEQYVRSVCDFSSQYGNTRTLAYSAYNITNHPSKFPDYGDFPEAFVMRTYGKWWDEAPSKSLDYMPQNNDPIVSHDYIVLEFEMEVFPVRISIYEIYNPGSIIAIWAKDETDLWFRLWNGPPQIVPPKPRIFSPPLQRCNFKTKMIRLEFNHSLLDYYTHLDAVLLIGTSELIVPNTGYQSKNLSSLLRELGTSQYNNEDCYNLTPNYRRVNEDLKDLKKTLNKHCVLYKSKQFEKVPIVRLAAKLGFHRHYIPPIEEAFNSLQKFLQEDFPKLIKEINLSSSITSMESELEMNINNMMINTCGNFAALPDELVLRILKNLDLKSLSRCSQVNRHFNNIACDALLYKRLNLKPYWYCVDATVLNSFIPRFQYLQQLDLSWCGNHGGINSKDFIIFLQNCGCSLTHLRLNCCRWVNDDVIREISQICKNIKELCLRSCDVISNSGFLVLENLENLEILDLYRTMIESDTLCSILRKNPQIRHLNLACADRLLVDEVAKELAISCKKLESIDFWKSEALTVQGIRAITHCTNLKEIDFGWCTGIGTFGDSLRILFSTCKNLEKVFLTAIRGLTDRDLEPLLLCRNLKQLDLLGACSLTPEICTSLLSCLRLQLLDLSFCDGISDAKIFEWRRLYPHVSIKRSSQGRVWTEDFVY